MAPEQIEASDVDGRADVFSVAVIAYRCLTSRPAFVGDEAAVMHQTLKRMPPRPSSLTAVDQAVDAVLAIGLAKAPGHRFERVGELAGAFESACAGKLSDDLRKRATATSERWPWA